MSPIRVFGRGTPGRGKPRPYVIVALLLLFPCASRAAEPAFGIGPWGVYYAHYDPALYGPERPLATLAEELGLPVADGKLQGVRVLVIKDQRRLELWAGERMVKAYRIQLSQRAKGDKVKRRDLRTPEGDYAVCMRRPGKYHRGLWLNYPNLKDAERGLKARLISAAEADAIRTALDKGECPPQTTKLGGDILLHGQQGSTTSYVAKRQKKGKIPLKAGLLPGDPDPAKIRSFFDWTAGCVALFNPDVRELYEMLPDGTPVKIVADAPVTRPVRSALR